MCPEAWRDEDGAALIEAALVLPILLLLVFGLADVSLYFWNRGLANSAVQLGVRRAIVSDAVAVGPGLDPAESDTYWDGLPPGQRCTGDGRPGGACPAFSVQCGAATGCRCTGEVCRFTFAPRRLAPILAAMQAVLPAIRPENVLVSYATNGLGYAGRPVPVPVDVTVSLVGLNYETLFLRDLLGATLPLVASARLPGEALVAR